MGNHHKMSLQDLVVVLSEVYGVYKKIAVSKYDEVEGGKWIELRNGSNTSTLLIIMSRKESEELDEILRERK